jgi:diadenosine tetraphosphate (Ap4A) HIT family hydrolase
MPLLLDPSSLVADTEHWHIAVNRNQNLLGKMILVGKRSVEAVVDLSPTEWAELHFSIRQVQAALDRLFGPDHYNHAFLMNIDSQVHLHVVPRYRGSRDWNRETFTDPHFGALFGTEQRLLDPALLEQLAADIRDSLMLIDATQRDL